MFVRERKRVILGIELGGMEDLGVRLWGHDGLLILYFWFTAVFVHIYLTFEILNTMVNACLLD